MHPKVIRSKFLTKCHSPFLAAVFSSTKQAWNKCYTSYAEWLQITENGKKEKRERNTYRKSEKDKRNLKRERKKEEGKNLY
jgi:hypothetical protein